MPARETPARPRSVKSRAAASSSADRVRRPVSRVARAWWRGRAPATMACCLYDEQTRVSRASGVPGAPPLEHPAEGVEGVGHDPVHAEVEQALHLGAVVDG